MKRFGNIFSFTFQVADLMLTVRPLLVRVLFIRRKKFLSLGCSAISFLLRPEGVKASVSISNIEIRSKWRESLEFNGGPDLDVESGGPGAPPGRRDEQSHKCSDPAAPAVDGQKQKNTKHQLSP